jgi:glycerate 2-kinase
LSRAGLLRGIFANLAAQIDGGRLVQAALAADRADLADVTDLPMGGPMSVLALGKVAGPMVAGLLRAFGHRAGVEAGLEAGLVVAPPDRLPPAGELPAEFRLLPADHPVPAERSLRAGEEVRRFVSELRPPSQLLVLLSGGGSALAVLPTPGLSLADKRAATVAVARGGASIAELNTVRKHLSAIKGGRLGVCCQVPVRVLALSDVVGNDPATIASGPFSPDPSTFAEALFLLDRHGSGAPGPARVMLARGAAGDLPETPKPGDPRLDGVRYQRIAGPELVPAEARSLVLSTGHDTDELARDTESDVNVLASAYGQRARREAATAGRPRILVGNGEPRIVVRGEGRGGRATHLALLVAREIAGLAGVTFLACGTDDRDGNSGAAGAVVDGDTWPDACVAGLDPEGALARNDSARPLEALGCLVRGPGTSNLLDLHLLCVAV